MTGEDGAPDAPIDAVDAMDAVDEAPARRILAACGLEPARLAALPGGVDTLAWRAETPRGAVVVRLARRDNAASAGDDAPRFEAQAAVQERLRERGVPAPRPVATGRTLGPADPFDGRRRWSVDEFAEGVPLDRAGTPPDAVRDLGALLAHLHALPAERYGMLEDRRDALRGSRDEMTEGLLSRWAALWPFDGTPLVAHPVARLAPHLLGAAGAMREPLLRYAEPPAALARAVCHGDLHSGHILVVDGRLAALIDFGDAFVAHPAWDIASFAHHHGWALTAVLLEGYERRRVLREVRLAEAQQLAVALALQKVAKWHGRDPDRLARILAFLAETLPLAARRQA